MGADVQQQIKSTEGIVHSLMGQLAKLAPHPNQPTYFGPLYVSIDSAYNVPSEHDGMLGSIVLESFLGGAFTAAASETLGNWTQNVDWSNAAEGYSTYMQDRSTAPINIGQRNMIARRFNMRAANNPRRQAFLRDLPRRMGIEQWLAYYQRKIYALRKNATISRAVNSL